MFRNFKSRNWTSWLIALAMVLTLVVPFNVSAAGKTIDIQILATSDTHGKFVPYEYATNSESKSGSMTQIATAIKKFKKENPNTILVDAGDSIQDNSASLFLDSEVHPMIMAMNEMEYDTWTFGNHEFNYGVPTLDKVASQFKGQALCGNVYRENGERLAKPYAIVEKAGVKIGIVGMTTPNITKWDAENLKEYKVTDPIEETKKVISEIKDKVDAIVAVVHMSEGQEYGVESASAVTLANECPELVAIVASHEHKAVNGERYNNTLLVENKNLAQTIAKIDIKLTEKDGKYVVNDKTKDVTSKVVWMMDEKTKTVNYESDKDLEEKLSSYHKMALDDTNQIIGELKGGDLVKKDEVKSIPTSQTEETPMINLINEVQMHYTKADVSAAAAFRSDANMKQGKIKKSDASLIYKFDNTMYLLELNGKQLKDYMEWSASYYNTYKPGDLTISFNENMRGYKYDMFSGVKYDIDISKEPGNRITNLRKMDNSLVKDTDTFKLVLNNYRADSDLLNPKSGIFKDGSLPNLIEKNVLGEAQVRDLIGKYIKEEKNGVITPQMNNNWKIIGNNWDAKKRSQAVKLINEGKIEIPTSKDGRTVNVASVTERDLEIFNMEKPKDKKPVVKPGNKNTMYTVKNGDCLYLIGKKYNISYDKIAKANNIKNVNLIFVGQKLVIPAK